MKLSISQAAKQYEVSRNTIYDNIKDGTISAENDERGRKRIDVSELDRVYPKRQNKTSRNVQLEQTETLKTVSNNSVLQKEIDLLRERLADKDEVIGDLRQRLDEAATQQTRLTALLTDQSQKTTQTWWQKLFGTGVS